jgi:hypothetical protein
VSDRRLTDDGERERDQEWDCRRACERDDSTAMRIT